MIRRTGRSPPVVPAPWTLLSLLVLTLASSAHASLQPFQPVETAAAVARRQACLENFYSCANQGPAFGGVCCQNGQLCALDASSNPACCPRNAVCTGTAPATFVPPAGGPSTTAVSYVSNTYFSFPYAATYFANPGHCSAALSQCAANRDACTAQLGGGGSPGYAVTIVVPGGGGTTVAAGGGGGGGRGTATYEPAAVTSICNSLSSEACRGLQPTMCTLSGTTAGGFVFGTETANGAAGGARPTGPAGLAAAAACVGLVGAVAAAAGGVAAMGIL